MDKFRYIVIDDDTHSISKTNEITKEIEEKIKEGYYVVIDLETMETIHSNRNNLFRRPIEKH